MTLSVSCPSYLLSLTFFFPLPFLLILPFQLSPISPQLYVLSTSSRNPFLPLVSCLIHNVCVYVDCNMPVEALKASIHVLANIYHVCLFGFVLSH